MLFEYALTFLVGIATSATVYTATKAKQIADNVDQNRRRSKQNRRYISGDPEGMRPLMERVQDNEKRINEVEQEVNDVTRN